MKVGLVLYVTITDGSLIGFCHRNFYLTLAFKDDQGIQALRNYTTFLFQRTFNYKSEANYQGWNDLLNNE